jgi:uncharacterized membrane protein YgdD (TMEM256/DUF423 family)
LKSGFWIGIGGLMGLLGVAAGAFGAHALRGLVEANRFTPRQFETFEVAVRYQMYHALALLVVGLLVKRATGPIDKTSGRAGWAFFIGILLFSGSLYVYVFTEFAPLVFLTPLGGLAFLVGWLFLCIAGLQSARSGDKE